MSDKTTAAIAAEQQAEAPKAPAEALPAITLDELEQVDLGTVQQGELKKLLAYTGEIATIQSTGEIVEGVTAYETPATFTVDI